jgi:hypothetical protein
MVGTPGRVSWPNLTPRKKNKNRKKERKISWIFGNFLVWNLLGKTLKDNFFYWFGS